MIKKIICKIFEHKTTQKTKDGLTFSDIIVTEYGHDIKCSRCGKRIKQEFISKYFPIKAGDTETIEGIRKASKKFSELGCFSLKDVMATEIKTFNELQDKLRSISLSFEHNQWGDRSGRIRIGEPGVYEVLNDPKKKKLKISYSFRFESDDFDEVYQAIKTLREMDLKINQEK